MNWFGHGLAHVVTVFALLEYPQGFRSDDARFPEALHSL